MKIKNKAIIILLFATIISYSQQIGEGHAPTTISDFSAPLKSGIYNGLNTTTTGMSNDNSSVWQHLFVARHISTINNYQLQIASSFTVNDRLFFRKIATGTLSSSNTTWIELATRQTNTFNGNQIINGTVGIGTINPSEKLDVTGNGLFRGSIISSISDVNGGRIQLENLSKTTNGTAKLWSIYNMTGSYGNSLQFWAYDNLGCVNGGMCSNRLTIMDNGNVGIGTANPTSKLTVAGNINSREVKVTVDAGADFVFENNYNLPSLDVVDKFIKENKHLPEIASADEMKKEGINLSEMNIKLLQKIEELTLYVIEMKKDIALLKQENRELKLEVCRN